MQIEVKGKNLQVTDEMREYVARRFDKIGKQVSELAVRRETRAAVDGSRNGDATFEETPETL